MLFQTYCDYAQNYAGIIGTSLVTVKPVYHGHLETNHKCDWICKKGSDMCSYKYLEIQLWNIQFNISREWL